MRFLVVSDFHGNLSWIKKTILKAKSEEVDGIVVCGDITHFGNISIAKAILEILAENGIPLVFVPGNCDPEELAYETAVEGSFCIHGRNIAIGGLVFLGIGGSTFGPFHTPFELSEDSMFTILDKAYKELASKNRFVLVSHNPPLNTKSDLLRSGIHVGSSAIRGFIEEKLPLAVLCGHIHEARSIDNIRDTLIINPGPAYLGFCALMNVATTVHADLTNL